MIRYNQYITVSGFSNYLSSSPSTIRMLNKTGLHSLFFAVHNDQLEAVKFLMEIDPKFEYGPDDDGDTPLLHAIAKAKLGNKIAGKEEKNWTPLHLCASNGDLDAIDEMIRFCPACTEMVDDGSHIFLHIAAHFGHTKVVKHVLETRDIAPSILNAQDIYGNTPFHIAALSGNENMTLSFLYDARVFKTTVNATRQKVLDAVTFVYDKKRGNVIGFRDKVDEEELKDQSDFDLLVGELIAAVSFTAGITVPGGYISDGENQGRAVLSKDAAFEMFVMSNTSGLLLSLYAVCSHFCTRRLLTKEDIELQVTVATFCTLGAVLAMVIAFYIGIIHSAKCFTSTCPKQ